MSSTIDLRISALAELYGSGALSPEQVIEEVYRRLSRRGDARVKSTWIHIAPEHEAVERARSLQARPGNGDVLPLMGIPFAVKDNIDVLGMPTTAACPFFSYMPECSAACVDRLLDAGAICVGKTNLDQFATGLNGTRSPYGACASVFNSAYVSGGSSSGSAVAVAAGQVSFALGTDTGGSGRIPAGFNNVIGLKPTLGLVPTRGLVPNCRTLDCVSVFALSVADACLVKDCIKGIDINDPFSRPEPDDQNRDWKAGESFRFAFLRSEDRELFGEGEAASLYDEAIARLKRIGGIPVAIEFRDFAEAGALMFEGPWVAERVAGLRDFMRERSEDLMPITRDIMTSAHRWSAVDLFEQMYRLKELKRTTDVALDNIDVLVVPTAPAAYTIAEVDADPIRLNNRFGYYSYFVNLLDMCAVAVPNGFLQRNHVPMGITLIAKAWQDRIVAAIAAAFHQDLGIKAGIPVDFATDLRVVA